jgi:hypothetical protein
VSRARHVLGHLAGLLRVRALQGADIVDLSGEKETRDELVRGINRTGGGVLNAGMK